MGNKMSICYAEPKKQAKTQLQDLKFQKKKEVHYCRTTSRNFPILHFSK